MSGNPGEVTAAGISITFNVPVITVLSFLFMMHLYFMDSKFSLMMANKLSRLINSI